LAVSAITSSDAQPDVQDREALWKLVAEADKKGLPKTGIEHLKKIISSALKDKDFDEAVKAIGKKITLEVTIQGNKPEEKIARLHTELNAAAPEMKPVMEALLANWYWHYFQQNRWRFMQRTQTSQAPSDDIQTWDLKRIFAEIQTHFDGALDAKSLKTTPIQDFDELLEKGNVPDKFRPTMYDFVAQDAISFYSAGEQAGAQAEDEFILRADGNVFAQDDQFLSWKVEQKPSDSPTAKALRLMQDLMKFHQKDDDRTAYLDVDLQRLTFGYAKASGEEKTARYKSALQRWSDAHVKHFTSSRALWHLAQVLRQEGELVKAREIAKIGLTRFPDSFGGRRCFNTIKQIESKYIQVNVERVWNAPLPEFQVNYKNINQVHFRVIAYNWDDRLNTISNPENLNRAQRLELLKRSVVKSWSETLEPTEDFSNRIARFKSPNDLKPGSYFLVASPDKNFARSENVISYSSFWVSDLSLIIRSRQGESRTEGFVLNANSGEPLKGAAVRFFANSNRSWRPAGTATTDANGYFTANTPHQKSMLTHVKHGGHALASNQHVYSYKYDLNPKPFTRTMFFTDRSLYRPGQTVRFKGLAIAVAAAQDSYEVLKGEKVTVVFRDHNSKEIEKHSFVTNDYGSFSGSVTTPQSGVTGAMSLVVETGPRGSSQFNVEEYKRPKFKVKIDPPKTPGVLNGEVAVTGKASAYTGAPIDGAKVRWRVVREVRYPAWWGWRYWWYPAQNSSQEIAHGVARTKPDGTFGVTFHARPDPKVSESDEPTFRYTVYSDVTDTTGETRSASHAINVGFTALSAAMTVAEWQSNDEPVSINVRTTTLDGVAQDAEGVLKIYRVKQPQKVGRTQYLQYNYRYSRGKRQAPKPDPSNVNSWPLGEVVHEVGVTTKSGSAVVSVKLGEGLYRARLETADRFGKPVSAIVPIRVLAPDANKLSIRVPSIVSAKSWSTQPGDDFEALWGSGYDKARAFVEIEHRYKVIDSYWTKPGTTQKIIKQKVTAAMRGGFLVRVTMVRENRAYIRQQNVSVPWTNKNLSVRWERFRSKLKPGETEKWTAVITGPDAASSVAEMVAGLYDASLDAYKPHSWHNHFNVFRHNRTNCSSLFANRLQYFQPVDGSWTVAQKDGSMRYRHYPTSLIANFGGYGFGRGLRRGGDSKSGMSRLNSTESKSKVRMSKKQSDGKRGLAQSQGPDLSNVPARSNLNETAFFFPHLVSNKAGEVKLEFTMPEALTEWKFLGFAHDGELRAGFIQSSTVTAKDLMVQPNPPRFVREGDQLEFTVKVTNQSAQSQTGKVRLTFADARTDSNVDKLLANINLDREFEIASKRSKSFSWRIDVPDDMGFMTYTAVASTGKLSDGEKGYLPVLSRRILVTESLPLPIRGPQTREFEFTRLTTSGKSNTLKHQSLTVQMVSNPSWYAVMALPYLMEYPHQCSEQTFNRLYANSIARHIATSDPKIRGVFEQWRNTPALDSPMQKNGDLKSLTLEETPWLQQAESEAQARRNVGILFDDNRLNDETSRMMMRLAEMQRGDGEWPWFPGGHGNDYITLYIVTGFGRMRHLGVDTDVAMAVKALNSLDDGIDSHYRSIRPEDRHLNHLSARVALYLYARSFYLKDQPVKAKYKEAVDYFLGQATKYWLQLSNRQSQAHLALAKKRFGDLKTAQGIMKSIKERSVSNEELGMFWRDTERSYWWYRAPIETQAMMIEAFDEVMDDQDAVENCKVWLLKQKQTQDWKTTKATADAIYGLLLRGTDGLASDALVEVSLGGKAIKPETVEAGTGFYEQRFVRNEIKPQMGKVSVAKSDEGVAWGSLHWQYLEDMSKVTAYEGTPLKVRKTLYIKKNTTEGPTLVPVKGPLAVGDELVTRIELRVDRDMEYVHMKDQRGAGTEPVNVLSRYRYQDGLGYYESTRDTASHFFISYLPKGVYVFEYSVRVQHKGKYQSGMTSVQCMYAPEFNSHSESFPLNVK
jgi:uncharacterized protein YfaS (alpha-2-macroglobulin family)